jgi:hypothetical protein
LSPDVLWSAAVTAAFLLSFLVFLLKWPRIVSGELRFVAPGEKEKREEKKESGGNRRTPKLHKKERKRR